MGKKSQMLMDLNFNIIILAGDARSYYDAYQVLQEKTDELRRIKLKKAEQHQKKSKGISVPMPITEHDMNFTTPALVCLAFSIELHVKLLLKTYDKTVKGHHIGKLIKQLPKEEKANISNHPDFHPTQQGDLFFQNIEIASDLFIRTRYYFEKVDTFHFNTGFCITLAKVIRKRIVERVPSLRYDLGEF
jgi:hypothetical protein